MRLEKYITRSEDITILSEADSIRAVQIILEACTAKRDELRQKIETDPKHCPGELKEDVDYLLGKIDGLNWVLGLPARSREIINKIE